MDPRDGDRIVLLGDGLFEREQQDGYLETALTASWPEKKLAFRNLGWSGDTPLGEARAGFGSSENTRSWQPPQQRDPDYGFKKLLQQVREAKPTVVFVAYGSAAAYDEPADRERFPNSLKRLAKELAADKVRLVLVTPTPHERLNPAQPDPKPRNERLAAVAEQIRKIAAEQGYPVLDLYTGLSPAPVEPLKEPSQPRPYASPPLTENGMHLGSDGYRRVAWAAREQLALPTGRWNLDVSVAEMKVAGQDGTQCKNITKTEYGVQFDVSDERLPALDAPEASHRVLRVTNLPRGQYALTVDGQRVAMAGADQWATGVGLTKGPEFAQTETLRAAIIEKNRLYFQYFRPQNEAYIFLFRRHERGDHASEIAQWAKLVERQEEEIARLRTPHPHHYELIREKDYPESWVPSAVADTDPEAERRSFTLADGMEINLFASEPMISNPININFDERGRMWVATSTTYPHLEAGMKPNDGGRGSRRAGR
ncbi:MAG: hypothetical protein K8T25_00030 [Planctomycetia bacterium]|nr:hypothetical protein [Planctomycetia bacterium]